MTALAAVQPLYVYTVEEVVRVVDGDSGWLRLDVGFRQTMLVNYRALGIDCPEKTRGSAFEKAEAKHAEIVAREWLTARHLQVRTEKDPDNFGRWLADIWDIDSGEHLATHLKSLGLASEWPKRWREV